MAHPDHRQTPPSGREWGETFAHAWWARDGMLGGAVWITVHMPSCRVSYWASLVGSGRQLVAVVADGIPLPSTARSLEVRADGLWADRVVAPARRISLDLEAFAVAVDDPAEMHSGERGDRVPFGFELDWTPDAEGEVDDPGEVACRVDGRVLVGHEELEIDGWGARHHSWGHGADRWPSGREWSAGRVAAGPGATGTPTAPGGFDQIVLARSPLLARHPDGTTTPLDQALVAFTDASGAAGFGWVTRSGPAAGPAGQPEQTSSM